MLTQPTSLPRTIERPTPVTPARPLRAARPSLVWLDRLKAAAVVWIFLNHVSEALFGFPYIANPTAHWPPLAARLDQLRPLSVSGIWSIPVNLLRYVGWSGDQGVQLFLIASGFGLTWGLLAQNSARLPLRTFYTRRLLRIYPLWIAAHVGLGLLGFALAQDDFSFRELLLSGLGLRCTPALFYAICPSWWYIGLLLQLYLVYPLLWRWLHRATPARFLAGACAAGFIARGLGLFAFGAYVDPWQRGAVFITRLPEFALGMALAVWMQQNADASGRLRSSRALALGILAYAAGTVLSLTWAGMTIAPFLLGLGAFVLLYRMLPILDHTGRWLSQAWDWIGRHSYALFLVHQPVVALLLPTGTPPTPSAGLALRLGLAALITPVAGVLLEASVAAAQRSWAALQRLRPLRAAALVGLPAGALVVALLGADLYVRQVDPQEVFGWGERPALVAHPTFGWHLRPSSETRLRWESYDYLVTANALGFPGPLYAEEKPPHTLRILTTGDAFTSAEGVDTGEAWPRVLERELQTRLPDQRVEVLNFAITGYGPNQYAAVVDAFAPRFHPNLIVIGFFVNDFEDVRRTNAWFRNSIGFGGRDPDGWYAHLTGAHVRKWLAGHFRRVRDETLRGVPDEHGYFLANLGALARSSAGQLAAASPLVETRLAEIKASADQLHTPVVLVLIPAPVQVCRPSELAYFPAHVDLTDASQFDQDQPQRLIKGIADRLGLTCCDLRPVLSALEPIAPYQARNMHWTRAAHAAVGAFLATRVPEWLP